MVFFTVEQLRKIMDNPNNIRNMTVVAHVDHGKSTLTDSLVAKAGLISQHQAGEARFTDNDEVEKERGITIKSTGVSLYYEYNQEKVLINLIDSPGHVDFSAEVTAALRVTDGALVVVDCVEGVRVQTETVLRQACQEKIKPVLMINKIDRAIIELQQDGETIYQNFVQVIDKVNAIVEIYHSEDMGSLAMSPQTGSVTFGAGKDCWAFSIPVFAQFYANKLGVHVEKMQELLWGDHYYDAECKKWSQSSVSESGKQLKRGFVQFIMDPILKLSNALLQNKEDVYSQIMHSFMIKGLSQEEKSKSGKCLMKAVMSRWMNAADTLLQMIVTHLPSPRQAQKYRTAQLYEGPQDDQMAAAMRNCDPKGPLMIFISKMINHADKFYAFGRIYSGTVACGQKVRIMGGNYQVGSKTDLFEHAIQRTVIQMGGKFESLNDVPCGNIVALVGLDKFIRKTCTISDHAEAHPIRSMKYSVSAVVQVAVQAKKPQDLPKLIEGLRRLQQSDQLVECFLNEGGENIVTCCGELHAEICLNDLEKIYAQVPIIKSDPVTSYRETVTAQSIDTCMTKSTNKLNRLFGYAEPLLPQLSVAIDEGNISVQQDRKQRAKLLVEQFEWDKEDALRIWSFGPDNHGPNILTEKTVGVQYLEDIRSSLEPAWQEVTRIGPLCEENMRGVKFNIVDCLIHSDAPHRGAGQIIPAARRLYYAGCLSAMPKLQEPIFLAEITTPHQAIGGVYNCLSLRRGQIVEETYLPGSPLTLVKAYLPVSESMGFTSHLRHLTQGQAFPQCVFDHWEVINGDPYDQASKLNTIIMQIRKRKALKPIIPMYNEYIDKL